MKIWAALALALLADMVGVLVSAWPGGAPPPAPHHLRTLATTAPALPLAAAPGGAILSPAAAAAVRQAAPTQKPAQRWGRPRSPARARQ